MCLQVFVNMMDPTRYHHKAKELVDSLHGKLSNKKVHTAVIVGGVKKTTVRVQSKYTVNVNMIKTLIVKTHIVKSHIVKSHIVKSYIVKSHIVKSYIVKSHIVKSHIVKTHIVKSHIVKTHIVKSHIVKKYALLFINKVCMYIHSTSI